MSNVKEKIIVYLVIAMFGIIGIYLTFIAGDTSKYDSQVKAYKISPNERYDSEDGTTYQPIYYFKVNEKDYECESKMSGNKYPNENKNTVYYKSDDPTKCKTEYEKSSSKLLGIIILIVTGIITYFFIIKKPSNNAEDFNQSHEEIEYPQLDEEKAEKAIEIFGKVQLIYKRVILGIIIIILSVITIFESMIFMQTIKAKDYIETTATYVDKKPDGDDEIFDDYIYTFVDKNGNQQEIIVSLSKDGSITPKSEIKVKYNENNPQEYYEEGSTLDKSGIIWYIVKIVAIILLIALFFNKKLLIKTNISATANRK